MNQAYLNSTLYDEDSTKSKPAPAKESDEKSEADRVKEAIANEVIDFSQFPDDDDRSKGNSALMNMKIYIYEPFMYVLSWADYFGILRFYMSTINKVFWAAFRMPGLRSFPHWL